MEQTQEDRIALIREAYLNSQAIAPRQSVQDFVADVKSEEVNGNVVERGEVFILLIV